jgi:hypothetical protein
VWAFCNTAVHGKLPQFIVGKSLQRIREDPTAAYQQFIADPHFIPQAQRYLFDKPLSSILSYNQETLRCWLASIRDAEINSEQRALLYTKQGRHTLHQYFVKKAPGNKQPPAPAHRSPLFSPPFSAKCYYKQSAQNVNKLMSMQ